jgi:hypothetical protein
MLNSVYVANCIKTARKLNIENEGGRRLKRSFVEDAVGRAVGILLIPVSALAARSYLYSAPEAPVNHVSHAYLEETAIRCLKIGPRLGPSHTPIRSSRTRCFSAIFNLQYFGIHTHNAFTQGTCATSR